MEVSLENTSTLGRRLKVSVSDAMIDEKLKEKMAKLSREVRLKGFRPGKVPAHILNQKFGSSVRSEAVREVVEQTLKEAFKEKGVHLAGLPTIENLKDKSGENLEYSATFEVYPDIDLKDLSGVEIEKRLVNITDEDVQKMIERLQEQFANWRLIQREAKSGDRLTVDFARLLKKEGAKKEEQQHVKMIVGAKGVLPGLDEALIGKSKGDQIEVALRYPEDWAEQAVANEEVTLWVTIQEVAEKVVLSEEDLAKRLGLSEDKTKFLESVRERMQEELETTLKDELKESALEKLIEKNTIELPNALIEQEKEAIRREMAQARKTKVSNEELNTEAVNQQAKHRVELGLLLNEVIKKHDLKADPEKVRAEINKIATRFSSTPEVVEAYYRNRDLLHSVERMVLLDQAVDVLLTEATLQEKEVSFDTVMNSVE